MLRRTCLCFLLIAAAACSNDARSLTAPSNASPVFISVGPGNVKPVSMTFQGTLITAPGSFLFSLAPSASTSTVKGTFANGVLQLGFSGGDLGLGGVKSGSVVVAQGPTGAVMSPCGVAWSLAGDAATVGQKFEVAFSLTDDSSQACQ